LSVAAWLNRPGPIARLWKPAYELGYQALKCGVGFVCRPLWKVRRVGRRARLPSSGVILCPNHASYLDPAFVQLVVRRRITFVMTEDFYDSPWGRWFYKLVGAVPIGRGRLARRGLRRAMALVRRGHAVVLFPEGRLSTDGHLHPPKRGIGSLARRTGAPVVPVAIAGSLHAWAKGRSMPGRANVRVAFAEPLRYAEDERLGRRHAERAFAERLMGRIAALLTGLQRKAPDPRDVPPHPPCPPALQDPESSCR
jgi:1-acyl-sn-glycerol-3-phosphate acyltransferase